MGNCGILTWKHGSSREIMYPHRFVKMHETSQLWNREFTNKLGLYLESCFGSGIQPSIQRRSLNNCLITQESQFGIPQQNNMWWMIDACATHAGYGSKRYNISLTSEQLKKVFHSHDPWFSFTGLGENTASYKGMVDDFNNAHRRCKEKAFLLLKKFFVDNEQDILRCIDDRPNSNYLEKWNATRQQILDDLDNMGMMYFCQYQWGLGSTSKFASDNYFDPDTKKYEINDGFIGWIKAHVFPDTVSPYTTNGYIDILKPYENLSPELKPIRTKILQNLNALNNQITAVYRKEFNTNHKFLRENAIVNPLMGCSGKFRNSTARFLQNPDEEEDRWLTSDNDLEQLASQG